MIYLYLLSNIFFLYAIKKQHVSVKNIFIYIYWGLMILYPMAVFSIFVLDLTAIASQQMHVYLSDKVIVDEVLFTSSIALITFTLCMLKFPIKQERFYENSEYRNKGFKYLFFLIFPIALYLNSVTNWTTDRAGLLPSLASYIRNIMTVLTVIIFVPRSVSTKVKIGYLLLFMVITFMSTQRTNAFIVIIALIYTLKSEKTAIKLGFVGILSLLILGSIRNGVNATNLVFPIMGEGLFGSWGMLQAIDVTLYNGYSWSQFFMLFNETLNWFLELLHIPIELPTLADVVIRTGVKYYPMGGFFYLSDAYLMNPILGPILYTILIYIIYRKSINTYYKYHTPLSLLCLSLLFDAIKGSLCVFFCMLLFHVLFYFFTKKLILNKVHIHNKPKSH